MITKQELAVMGARSHLIDLNKRRLELLKMFPELDVEGELKPAKRTETPEPPVGASGRKLVKKGGAYRAWSYMSQNPSQTFTAQQISEVLGIKRGAVYSSLNQLVAQKLAKRVGRGSFKLL